ncbi:DUF6366 family protein [Alteribacter natronophilus]|uniref:DUF6366 family protein n=1 Tax=Alteribacter natronophilus TaxID=2583810 RepID=UPI00110EECB0|nr:DUF6366 family protein [Alteribacter natronophilus]TMW70320.1 hypothetical protein FGB90_16730 [Alteribacter natronophilus]
MSEETPQQRRENIRKQEQQRNPGGHMADGFNRARTGGLADAAGESGWKGTLIFILVLIILLLILAVT